MSPCLMARNTTSAVISVIMLDGARSSSAFFSNSTLPLEASDRKSTRLNSSHTVIYTLSLHDALPIFNGAEHHFGRHQRHHAGWCPELVRVLLKQHAAAGGFRSEEHTSELQSHSDLHSFPTRRSSDL